MAGIKPLTGNAGDFSGIILKAAAAGNLPAVDHYLSVNPAWLNQQGPHGRTMLWEAVNKGRLEMARELVRRGADVDAMGAYYTPMLVELTPLAVAEEKGFQQLAELLMENGASDNLYSACHRGDLAAMEVFLAQDSTAVNRPSKQEPDHPRMGWHPLHYAVAGQQLPAVKMLVDRGALVAPYLSLLVDWADTNTVLVQYLKRQVAPQVAGTPAPEGHTDIPVVDRPDDLGFPPLVDACRGNHNAPDDPSRVQLLLDRSADVNIRDHKGKTPLHRASQAGFIRITRLLLESDADPEIPDNQGGTPLFDAAYYGRVSALSLLVQQGANREHVDKRGETALFAAARGRRPATLQALLQAGANADHHNLKGQNVAEVIQTARNQTNERRQMLQMLSHQQP